jgi:hypothetical protein
MYADSQKPKQKEHGGSMLFLHISVHSALVARALARAARTGASAGTLVIDLITNDFHRSGGDDCQNNESNRQRRPVGA